MKINMPGLAGGNMRKNILLIIGLVFVITGAVMAYFANFPQADAAGFAVTMFGAGLATAQVWNKRDKTKKTWLALLSVFLLGAGAFLLGFGQFSQDTMVTVISAAFGLAAIIGSLIISVVQTKEN